MLEGQILVPLMPAPGAAPSTEAPLPPAPEGEDFADLVALPEPDEAPAIAVAPMVIPPLPPPRQDPAEAEVAQAQAPHRLSARGEVTPSPEEPAPDTSPQAKAPAPMQAATDSPTQPGEAGLWRLVQNLRSTKDPAPPDSAQMTGSTAAQADDPTTASADRPAPKLDLNRPLLPESDKAQLASQPGPSPLDPEPALAQPEESVQLIAREGSPPQPPPTRSLPDQIMAGLRPHLTVPQQVTDPQIVTSAPERIEIRLDPEELGRVQFILRGEGDSLRVMIAVERPETLDLMRRHADLLSQSLREAGFSGSSLSFSAEGGDTPDRGPAAAPSPGAGSEPDSTPLPQTRIAPSDGGLNLLI